MLWYGIIGLVATVLIAIFSMPQLVKVIKTKNTESISLWMYIILVSGNLCFAINGLGGLCDPINQQKMSSSLPIFLGNSIACVASAVILFFKIRNIKWSKARGISESQLAQNYAQIKADEKQAKLTRKLEKQKLKQQKVEDTPSESVSTAQN